MTIQSNNFQVPKQAKWAFTTRRVEKGDVQGLESDVSKAGSGDLVLAQIVTVGSHKRIQLATGRNSDSHVGDYVVLCCGARYAPDQFEGIAEVPVNKADLLAGGGVVGRMRKSHGRMSKPTQLKPIGLLTDANGQIINIQRYKVAGLAKHPSIPVIAVTGTAMNSGKTTSAFSLVNGLVKSNKKVAAIKVTGTGAFGDFNAFADAGADIVLDFTDAGMVTTYQQPLSRILNGALDLLNEAKNQGADVVVVELGDGILQNEAWELLTCQAFKNLVNGIIFAAPDALSAIAGISLMQNAGLDLIAVSGLLTRSPLLCEEYSRYQQVPVWTKQQLSDQAHASQLLNDLADLSLVA